MEFIPLSRVPDGVRNVAFGKERNGKTAVSPHCVRWQPNVGMRLGQVRTDVKEEVPRLRSHVRHHQARRVKGSRFQIPVLL
jgi:hypothetical protein